MLSVKVVGVGAAGNKAAIKLIEDGVVSENDVVLLNSTLKDVPQQYKDLATEIKGSQGCAKERKRAQKIIVENLKTSNIALDTIAEQNDAFVIIVTSVEGGTGSGVSTVIAKYFSEVLERHVHMFAFTGFEDDLHGLKNTVDWFSELKPEYVVEAISNKAFLEEANGNKLKAQEMANQEFSNRVRILIGKTIGESEENIDDADLFKLDVTPGFMTIERKELNVKNIDEFNKQITDMIDYSKSLTTEASAHRIGVILSINDRIRDNIDWTFQTIRNRYVGKIVDDFFTHVQPDIHGKNEIELIVAGMKMPIDEVRSVYQNFKESTENANTLKDDFFKSMGEMNTEGSENLSDYSAGKMNPADLQSRRASFFTGVGPAIPVKTTGAQNIKKIAKENF